MKFVHMILYIVLIYYFVFKTMWPGSSWFGIYEVCSEYEPLASINWFVTQQTNLTTFLHKTCDYVKIHSVLFCFKLAILSFDVLFVLSFPFFGFLPFGQCRNIPRPRYTCLNSVIELCAFVHKLVVDTDNKMHSECSSSLFILLLHVLRNQAGFAGPCAKLPAEGAGAQ